MNLNWPVLKCEHVCEVKRYFYSHSGEFVIAQHQIPQRSFQATEGHAGDGVQVIVFNFKSPGSWDKILDVIRFICKENVDKSNDQDIHMSIK